MNKRECGTCSKCCEGWLLADIKPEIPGFIGDEESLAPGKPCRFLNMDKNEWKGVGCTIYEYRPYEPCERYKCVWLNDDKYAIPEWLKPNLSNIIISEKDWEGGKYWWVCETRENIRGEVLNWLMIYCETNQINVEYTVNSAVHYRGSPDFRKWISRYE